MERDEQIRIVIVKGRQQGISTFCRAMINWRLNYYPQTNGLIVAQREKDLREKAFRSLRDMFDLQTQKMPLGHSNSTQLKVDHGRSGYSACFGEWAQAEGQSRGDRYNIVHLTEADYYPDWNKFWGGLSQSIPNGNGSIVLIESTSAGRRALWDMYQQSLSDDSPFEHVFLPWYVQEEYKQPVPLGFELTDEEKELKQLYKLQDDQIFWYRRKRSELGSDIVLKREYPCTVEEAFSVSSNLSFFDYDTIQNAVKAPLVPDSAAPLIVGIDPSRVRDKTALVWRKGRNIVKVENMPPAGDIMYLARQVYAKIVDMQPKAIFCDIGGLGAGFHDALKAMGVMNLTPVNFGEKADDSMTYLNKRAEMYARFREWISHPPVSVPDDQELLNQLLMIELEPNKTKVQILAKQKMIYSPDLTDAAALTFYNKDSDYFEESVNSSGAYIDISSDWNPHSI